MNDLISGVQTQLDAVNAALAADPGNELLRRKQQGISERLEKIQAKMARVSGQPVERPIAAGVRDDTPFEEGEQVMLPRGTLVAFAPSGTTHFGFVVGTCAYDGVGHDGSFFAENAYVIRYLWRKGGMITHRPYTVVDIGAVTPVREWVGDFLIGGQYIGTPPDRCDGWAIGMDTESGNLVVVPAVRGDEVKEDLAPYRKVPEPDRRGLDPNDYPGGRVP